MKEYIQSSYTYAEYIKLIDDLLLDGKTTGPNQSEAMFGYARLNRQRMHRLEKTVELNDGIRMVAGIANRKMIWLIITEGWCGDAAQNIPIIEKIAAENPYIETRYILRDDNPGLMDGFLTAGARSIPKLIAIDAVTFKVLGTWGPRPGTAQEYFVEMKSNGVEKATIMENMQRWYNSDAGRSLQNEFEKLIAEWSRISRLSLATV